jgi:hypothetical protein
VRHHQDRAESPGTHPAPAGGHDVHLSRTGDRAAAVDALADRLGGRVGLDGVLADLNRAARPARVPGRATTWGFRWDEQDQASRRWWPQGITSSADADPAERYAGREVLLTSAYGKRVDGVAKGARVTVVDVTDRRQVRYRHVLLVEAVLDDRGGLTLRPVPVHAGGIVWHGPYLHVAGTARGLTCFRLSDILAARTGGDRDRLGLRPDRVDSFGYRYLLPVRFTYEAHAGDGVEPMRYSFLSLDRSGDPPGLVAGEYGRLGMSTRLARFDLDPGTALLRTDHADLSRPVLLSPDGVGHMQGATVVGSRWYVTTSHGPRARGSVWTGRPGRLRRRRWALPPGPEDIAYWPSTDQLWSLTEHPGRRWVFAIDRRRLD